jgi:hypothetical protein
MEKYYMRIPTSYKDLSEEKQVDVIFSPPIRLAPLALYI